MPIYNIKPIDNLPTTPVNEDKISVNSAAFYTGNNVKIPLYTHIDGTPYSTTFYTQVLGVLDSVNNNADITDPTLKQYLKIIDLTIRLTTALSHTDIGNGRYQVNGAATLYPIQYNGKFITPQIGDRFTAIVESGQYGEYEITNVVRASMYQDSAWELEFILVAYCNNSSLDRLESFVVQTLIYDVKYINSAHGPLRTIAENNTDVTKELRIKSLVSHYYELYFDSMYGTFIVSMHGLNRVYDNNIIKLWSSFLGYTDGKFKLPAEYQCNINLSRYKYKTIFDVIMTQDIKLLPRVVKTMSVVAPTYGREIRVPQDVSNQQLGYYLFPQKIADVILFQNPLTEYYIFSKEFYTNEILTIPLEMLMRKFILKEVIQFAEVNAIVDSLYTLPDEDKFYYIPLTLLLLKVSV